jgi:hypothetical protein
VSAKELEKGTKPIALQRFLVPSLAVDDMHNKLFCFFCLGKMTIGFLTGLFYWEDFDAKKSMKTLGS